jgi:hypothetical protein
MNNPFEVKKNKELDDAEKKLLAELKKVSGRQRLTVYDILEWSAQKLEAFEGEVTYFLPELKIYVKVEV